MVVYYGFNLHFPDDELCWSPFYTFISFGDILFCLCLKNRVVFIFPYIVLIQDLVRFMNYEYLLPAYVLPFHFFF